MAKKKPKIKTLKTKLDNIFSQYIRLRDSDNNGYGRCVTCKKVEYWKDADCGHFISRAFNQTRFEETNCAFQCRYCNRYRNGMPDEYAKFIYDEYGEEEYERLRLLKYTLKKFSVEDYQKMIAHYKAEVKKLMESKDD